MKLHSIQFKFLITVISAILAIAVCVGGLSIYEVGNYTKEHTSEFLDITCANEAAQVNDIFGDIEKSVKIMESYVLSLCGRVGDIEDHDIQMKILELVGEMYVDVAVNTDGAVAYYMRFDPEISDNKTGMFYSKLNGGDEYVSLEPTDLSMYEKDDIEHVGWYWQPYEAGKPIWLAPYYNQNNDILMISYVIPLFFENRFIGIVGMDFNYTILTERIHEIKIYENGHAHLTLNGVVVHIGNDAHDEDHSHADPNEYLQVSKELANGMTLVLYASYKDINQIPYKITCTIIVTVFLLVLLFSLIVFFMLKKIIKPLQELTAASTKLSNGNYDVEIVHSNNYEIKQLSTAFESMLLNLREHEKLQHMLAYRDSLTGLRNATSYNKWVINFDKKIKDGDVSFGVIVFDLNCLKETNDTYGHNVGNKLIEAAAGIISSTFKRSPVFRIGGDEFAVILQNQDLEDREALFARFESECMSKSVETDSANISISIAKGFSMFDPSADTQFSDVFNRADDQMYVNKKIIKSIQHV